MKKFVYILLICILIVSAAACGNSKSGASKPSPSPKATDAVNTEAKDETNSDEIDYYSLSTTKDRKTVEGFAAEIKKQILDKDWAALSENIAYPITVGEKTFNSKEEFSAFDIGSLLSSEFYKTIENDPCEKLFTNYQGIMLGNGEVWFADITEADGETTLKIIAINP